MKILGIGNALVDVLVLINDDSLLEQMGLPKGSMQLIDKDKLNILNEIIRDMDKSIASGGSAANTIAGLGKLGIESGFIGKTGKDFYGSYFKNDLEKYNVKSHLIESDETSGVATTFISKNGERTFGTYLGTAANLTSGDLKAEDFKGYEYLYIEGYLVQNIDLVRTAISLAKEAGLKIIFDLASYNIVEENRDFLLEIIPQSVDILFANEEEAKALLNAVPENAVSTLAEQVEIAIVKTGATGSWIQRGKEKVFVPALIVDCVDTTGAGDLYAAGFLYGLIKGYSLEDSGKIGTLLAARVIEAVGARIKADKWDDIFKTINKYN